MINSTFFLYKLSLKFKFNDPKIFFLIFMIEKFLFSFSIFVVRVASSRYVNFASYFNEISPRSFFTKQTFLFFRKFKSFFVRFIESLLNSGYFTSTFMFFDEDLCKESSMRIRHSFELPKSIFFVEKSSNYNSIQSYPPEREFLLVGKSLMNSNSIIASPPLNITETFRVGVLNFHDVPSSFNSSPNRIEKVCVYRIVSMSDFRIPLG